MQMVQLGLNNLGGIKQNIKSEPVIVSDKWVAKFIKNLLDC